MTFMKEEVEKVTGNFCDDNLVVKGGFGKVYRGKLRCSDVAVKVFSAVSASQKEFSQHELLYTLPLLHTSRWVFNCCGQKVLPNYKQK